MSAGRWKQGKLPAHQKYLIQKVPLLIAGAYATVSALWIAFSDRALSSIAGGYANYQILQTYKGWGFVAVSALLIYFLLRGAWKRVFAAYEASRDSERRLELALTSAGGGIWEREISANPDSATYISGELVRRLGLPPGQKLTLAELRERRHPDDGDDADRKLVQTIRSGGKQPYDVRYRVRCEDGAYRWVHLRGNIVESSDGRPPRMVGVALDIDDHIKADEQVRRLLRYDPVTGLSRQSKFLSDLDAVLATAPAQRWVAVASIKLLDLDRLIEATETVEDAALIRVIGDRLHGLSDMLTSRNSADVFTLAGAPAPSPADAQRIMSAAVQKVLEPAPTPNDPIKIPVQIGGAFGRSGVDTAIGLLRNSRHAIDRANRTTENEIRWFDEEIGIEFSTRADRISGLDGAVPHKEIECHYQPLIDLKTGRTAGFEALARWRRQDGTLLQPDDFIGLAEEVGKIAEIGAEVLMQACQTAASWPTPDIIIAINVSPLQFEDPTFPGIVAHVLKVTNLSPTRLELEITENALLRDRAVALQRILALRDLGVSIAIDDFGTGYSSLDLLSRIPFTRLKIDRSFISGERQLRENEFIVDTIINLARNLGLNITAEGVETANQAQMLAARGVELAQGFYFSEPVPAPDAAKLITKTWPLASTSSERHPGLRLVQ